MKKTLTTLKPVFMNRRFLSLITFIALLLSHSAAWAVSPGGSYSLSSGVLTISINAATSVTVQTTGSGNYTFILAAGGWTGSGVTGVSASSTTLSVLNTATQDTIKIVDGAGIAGVIVTFANNTTNTYDDNFNVTLNSGAGTVTFNNTNFSGSNALNVTTDKNIIVNYGSTLSTVNGDLTLSANMQPTQNINNFNGVYIGDASQASSTYVRSTGTGNVSISGRGGASASIYNYGVYLDGSTSFPTTITSGGGSLTVTGIGGGTGSSTFNDGLTAKYSTITSGGNGNVSVSGTGGGSTSANAGVYLSNTSNISSGGSGSVTVTGTGTGGSVSGTGANGVGITGVSHITSGGMGNVLVTGQGSTACIGIDNTGVIIEGYSASDTSSISSGGGNVTVNGTGGGTGASSSYNIGVSLGQRGVTNFGIIKSGGNGSVTVTGTGSNMGFGYNWGVLVYGTTSRIAASGTGSVSITGYGMGTGISAYNYGIYTRGLISGNGVILNGYGGAQCTGSSNYGTYIYNNSRVYATGTGTVTVNGYGGGMDASGNNHGIFLTGASGIISSQSGNVSVTGFGGSTLGTGDAISNYGIYETSSAVISAGGTGTVTILGTGGGKGDAATGNTGVYTNSATITSGGGNVSVEGHEGAGTASSAVNLAGASTISTLTNGGLLTLKGNSLKTTSLVKVPLITGNLNVIPATAAVNINMGLATDVSGGPIAISATEIGNMSGGHLNFGDANTDTITISATMLTTAGCSIKLTTALTGGVIPSFTGNDFTLQSDQALSFGSGTPLKIDIGGTIVNDNYQQLKVVRTVILTGATLSLSGSFIPTEGDVFTIVSATSVNGIFTGLAEGAKLNFNGKYLTINYTATAVTLTTGLAIPAPTITSFTPATAGSGTFIAIIGTNFTGANSVKFGGTEAVSFTVVDAETISAQVAGGTTGTVSVSAAGGTVTSTATFTYKPAFLTNLVNVSISSMGASASDYNGQAFTTGSNGYTLNSVDLSITLNGADAVVKLYSAAAGAMGSEIATLSGTWVSGNIYNYMPSSPLALSANTTYWLVLYSIDNTTFDITDVLSYTGAGTIPTTNRVAYSGDAGLNWEYYSASDPAPNYSSPFMFALYGEIIPAPTITSFTPTSAASGTTVTITGTNFTGATAVSFGGTAATSFAVVNATSITAVVASGTTGTISITTAGGIAISAVVFTYFVPDPVTVAATLGTVSGGYATLKAAFDAINLGTHQGEIDIHINANLTETATDTLRASGTGTTPNISSYSFITISPNGGAARTISGNLASKLIFLNGADNVTIDGLNTGGNSLTIDNASTNTSASAVYFDNDASNNIITNCTILGSSTSTSVSATIMFGNVCPVTGNDNNNINHSNIGPSGSNLPYIAINFLGGTTVATANSGNTISYNNIYDWFCPTNQDYGIQFFWSNCNINTTIDHNSFYQTATRTKTVSSYSYAMNIYTTSPGISYGHTITNNYIGGSAPQCGGSAMTYNSDVASAIDVTFDGIYLNQASTFASTISNNVIKNIAIAAGGSIYVNAIQVQSGAVQIDNNTIGSATDNSSFVLSSAIRGVSFYGIYNTSTALIQSINNNTIGGITIDGKNSSGSYENSFYGIFISSTTSTIDTIKNNLIGSLTTANSVSVTNSTGVCRMWYEGIYLAGFSLGIRLIDSNTIANITLAKDATRGNADNCAGIYSAVPGATISNNEIYNLKNGLIYQATYLGEFYAPVIGINLSHTSGTTNVRNNKIHGLRCTSTTSTLAFSMAGIYKSGNGLANIEKNFIYGISSDATTPAGFEIRGISANLASAPTPAATLTISNNIIMLGLDDAGNSLSHNHNYSGIYLNYISPRNVYYNTCYIGGTGITGAGNSKAFYQTGTAAEDIRNNIFFNARTNTSATGKHYAISTADATISTCDYNDYYVSGTGGLLGQLNTTDKTTLLSWQATTLGDTHSYTKNPALSNAGGILAANYLPSHPNLVAATGTGSTTDYTGATRSVTYPAMGAYEYTVIPLLPVEVTATLGTAGPILYTNLKSAFDAINLGTHQGAITIKINDNTTETASAKLNASGTGTSPNISSYSSVNIYPTATGLTIAGNLAAPLIDLNGADTVTIDGRVNATGSTKDLTITNISTLSTAGTSTVRFINDASYNTVKYCTIKGSTYDANGGVLLFSTGTTTGNIGNHIDNNDITTADNANRPKYAIFSLGTSNTIANSMDTISNNNIYDFLNTTITSCGIALSSFSTDWVVTANTFYETTAFAPTAANIYYAININNTAGNNFKVTDNYIGGSASDHSGSWSVSALNVAHQFCGINLNVGTTTASSIQNNTIQNMSYSCSAATPWVGISLNAGNINVGTVSGNTIGSKTETNTVVLTNSTSGSVKSYGIYIYNSSIIDIQNNTVGGITTIGSATLAHGFSGINKLASGGITTISNNTVKNITAQSTATSTYEAQSVYGIYSAGSGAVTIANDSIYNLTNNTRNQVSATLGRVQGIVTTAGTNIITGNIVHDLTINNANTSLTNTAPVLGISQSSTTIKQNVSGNTIYNLSNTYVYFSGGVIGLYYTGATTDINTVSGNLIYGLSATSSGTGLYGVKIDGGATTYSNNIINLNGNNSSHLYGFKDVGGTNNVYFNTVYIYGSTPVGSNLNSFCLHSNGSNVRDYRNNIFVNNRFSGIINPCVRIENLSNLTIDYNDYYYFITAGANQGVGMSSSTIYASFADFKGYTGQDTHSKNVDPGFASAGGSLAANYLPSQSSLVAATGTGITTDYAGVSTRSLTFPAMGAWEYAVSSAPGLNTTDFTGISLNSATTGGNTIVSLGSLVTAKGVVWSVSTAPSISLTTKTSETVTIGSEAADFSSSITGLDVNTKYYVRAYATNNMGTGYADEKNFWTLANVPSAPTVNNPQLTSLDVAINTNSNPAITKFAILETVGNKYVQTNGTLGTDSVWQTEAQWEINASNTAKTVSGLSENTRYVFKVKAKNGGNAETLFSSSDSLYTLAKVPAMPAINAAATTTLNVAVNANANPAITQFALQENDGSKYVQSDGSLGDDAAWKTEALWEVNATNTAKTVNGLSANTQNTFKVKARNGNDVETAFSGTASLYTLANVPSPPTVNNPTATSLDVAVNANSNPDPTEFAIQDSINGTFVQANGTRAATAVWQTATSWGTKTVSGLNTGVMYYFRVKAKNGDAVETTYSATKSGKPVAAPIPVAPVVV